MPTDREYIKMQDAGRLGTTGAVDPKGEADYVHADVLFFDKASADAMANTTTSETYTGVYFPRKVRLLSVTYVALATGITADNTNYATVTVSKRDSAAGNKATVATLTTTITSSGNVTTGAGKALVLTAANVVVDAGSSFTFEIAKAGSGVIVPAGRFTVHYTYV
jgi:hypothetical protein